MLQQNELQAVRDIFKEELHSAKKDLRDTIKKEVHNAIKGEVHDAIKEELYDIRREMSEKFEAIDERFDNIDKRFSNVDKELKELHHMDALLFDELERVHTVLLDRIKNNEKKIS